MVAEDLLRTFYKLFCFRFCVLSGRWKTLCSKILRGILERFLYENNRIYNSYKSSYKFAFILFLSFRRNQKQESNFHQVDDLVNRNIFVFCWQRIAKFSKGMPNSIDFFYKRIFLHVIPARIIVAKLFYTWTSELRRLRNI